MQALAVAVVVIPAEYRSARLEQLSRRNFSVRLEACTCKATDTTACTLTIVN